MSLPESGVDFGYDQLMDQLLTEEDLSLAQQGKEFYTPKSKPVDPR